MVNAEIEGIIVKHRGSYLQEERKRNISQQQEAKNICQEKWEWR